MHKDELEFLQYQHQQQTEFQRKQRMVRDRENAALERNTTTKHTQIPNMRDAMSQVRNSSQEYSDEYKDYIKRTSGRCV